MDDLSVCTCVRTCIGPSGALWENGGSDPDAVWHNRSDGSRDEADTGIWGSVHGDGYFWGRIWGVPCNQWRLYGVRVRQRRDAAVFSNYLFTCILSTTVLSDSQQQPGAIAEFFGLVDLA